MRWEEVMKNGLVRWREVGVRGDMNKETMSWRCLRVTVVDVHVLMMQSCPHLYFLQTWS